MTAAEQAAAERRLIAELKKSNEQWKQAEIDQALQRELEVLAEAKRREQVQQELVQALTQRDQLFATVQEQQQHEQEMETRLRAQSHMVEELLEKHGASVGDGREVAGEAVHGIAFVLFSPLVNIISSRFLCSFEKKHVIFCGGCCTRTQLSCALFFVCVCVSRRDAGRVGRASRAAAGCAERAGAAARRGAAGARAATRRQGGTGAAVRVAAFGGFCATLALCRLRASVCTCVWLFC